MSFATGIIDRNSLLAEDQGYSLLIQIPWYRSLPLSSLEGLDVVVDGEHADPGSLTLEVNSHIYSLREMRDKWQEFWFIQDRAKVTVKSGPTIGPGQVARVRVETSFRIPYILIGPETALVSTLNNELELTAN